MKWTLYWIIAPVLATGSLVAGSMALSSEEPASGGAPGSQQTEPATEEDEDFIPTEDVPADSAISFPVDI